MGITLKSNETELLDESRGNCISGTFRCNATSSSLLLPSKPIISETRFSENHPGVVSTSSSLPQSSPWQQIASVRTGTPSLMVTVSMMFLARMSSNSERIPNTGRKLSSFSLTWIFREMRFRVSIDGCSMLARLGLIFRRSKTRIERAIRKSDDQGQDITHKICLHL